MTPNKCGVAQRGDELASCDEKTEINSNLARKEKDTETNMEKNEL